MSRDDAVRQIRSALGPRQLIWFGTRGEDAEALCDIEQFAASYSLISAFDGRLTVEGFALEDLTRVRVDLDAYDLDDHLRDEAVQMMRDRLLGLLSRPSALVTYRPSTFLSAVSFSRLDRCLYLGLFKGHQDSFEHKPWLETAVAGLGLPTIPWRYIPDVEMIRSRRLLEDGPIMLRRSRTSGGVGLAYVDDPALLDALWPDEDEAYVSVAPFVADAVPLNISAVVWREGVTVHPLSLQLVGVPELTTRRFGYCGNDFAAAARLDRSIIEQVERATRAIGTWLGGFGYRGVFGVDFLVKDGVVLFTEVNPRFQGSTHLSCQVSVEKDESCLLLDHLAAHLGLPMRRTASLADQMSDGMDWAHTVVHNVTGRPASIDPGPTLERLRRAPGFARADVATRPDLATAPGATTARVTWRRSVTSTGYALDPEVADALLAPAPL
jgi:hypothetical protein